MSQVSAKATESPFHSQYPTPRELMAFFEEAGVSDMDQVLWWLRVFGIHRESSVFQGRQIHCAMFDFPTIIPKINDFLALYIHHEDGRIHVPLYDDGYLVSQ